MSGRIRVAGPGHLDVVVIGMRFRRVGLGHVLVAMTTAGPDVAVLAVPASTRTRMRPCSSEGSVFNLGAFAQVLSGQVRGS